MDSSLNDTANFMAFCANASVSEVTSEFWEIDEQTWGKVRVALLLMLAIVGLPWNVTIAVTILRKKLYRQPTIMLLLNVVIGDLLLILYMLPIQAVSGITGKFGGPSTKFSDSNRCRLCKAGFMTFIFMFISLFTISLLSFDRFLFIYKPLKYERLITSTRMLLAVIAMWFVSILVAALPLFGFGEIVFVPSALGCQAVVSTRHENALTVAYSALIIIFAAIPIILLITFDMWVVVIVVKNISTIYSVKKHMNMKVKTELLENMRKKRNEKQLHLVKVFGGLLCCSLIVWLPALILSIWSLRTNVPYSVYFIVNISFVTQVVTHPFAETFLIRELRDAIKRTVPYCKKDKNAREKVGSKSKLSCYSCSHTDADGKAPSSSCGFVLLINTAILHHYLQGSAHHKVGDITATNAATNNQTSKTDSSAAVSDSDFSVHLGVRTP